MEKNIQSGFRVTGLYPFNTVHPFNSVDYNKMIVRTIPIHGTTKNIDDMKYI
jgi:hypothetical protein